LLLLQAEFLHGRQHVGQGLVDHPSQLCGVEDTETDPARSVAA
jgi:hypothetical protein